MRFRANSLVRAAALAAVLVRVARARRTRSPLGRSQHAPNTTVSVVVPVRNEVARIAPLLDVVVGAPGVHEVIVVDDGSTDATARLASEAGATVLQAPSRAPGWAGKSWALQQGLEAASGDWIVTLDADTRPSPALPAAAVARAERDGTDLLTVTGRFVGGSAAARWLHSALLTTLVYRFGPPGQATQPATSRVLANGQCMVFRRGDLLSLGGFEAVAGDVVEDVALARHLTTVGRRVDMLDGSALLNVELYPSFAATSNGWGRSIGLPGVETRARHVVDVATLALTLPIPLIRLASGRVDPIDVVALAVRFGTLVGTRTAFARHGAAYWLSPLADPIAVPIVAVSAFARNQTWKGRTYSART